MADVPDVWLADEPGFADGRRRPGRVRRSADRPAGGARAWLPRASRACGTRRPREPGAVRVRRAAGGAAGGPGEAMNAGVLVYCRRATSSAPGCTWTPTGCGPWTRPPTRRRRARAAHRGGRLRRRPGRRAGGGGGPGPPVPLADRAAQHRRAAGAGAHRPHRGPRGRARPAAPGAGAARAPGAQSIRGRWWAAWRCQDDQSCGTSCPHTSSSCGMPFAGEQRREVAGARQRAGGVDLPRALADDEGQVTRCGAASRGGRRAGSPRTRWGCGSTQASPRSPQACQSGRVVGAGQAQRAREDVRVPQRDVGGVEGAEAAAEGGDRRQPAAVVVDEGHHLVEHPALVLVVPRGPLLQRQRPVRPGGVVGGVDAVELEPAGVQQEPDRVHHAVVLEVPGPAGLGGEHEHRAAPVAVAHDLPAEAARGRGQLGPSAVIRRPGGRPR